MRNARWKPTWRTFHKASGDSGEILLQLLPFSIKAMHSSSCFAARLNRPVDQIPYTKDALQQDLLRLGNAWHECQASRDRDAVYGYLSAVFDLVAWWTAEGHAVDRGRWALRLQHTDASKCNEPFAALILCTADPTKVEKRTRSKWSRVLRCALEYKSPAEPLDQFIKRKGGINECASRFARRLGRRRGAALPV
jgi:hypothetical protein